MKGREVVPLSISNFLGAQFEADHGVGDPVLRGLVAAHPPPALSLKELRKAVGIVRYLGAPELDVKAREAHDPAKVRSHATEASTVRGSPRAEQDPHDLASSRVKTAMAAWTLSDLGQ